MLVENLSLEGTGLKPFLKWAGGKYRIVHRIREQLPPGHRLVEPFVGSGAVFLNLDYPGYLLCDNNADLINLFQVLKEEGETFVKYCRDYFTPASNREEEYYRFRSEFNRTGNKKQKAALCLYLNRHGYNGLCRYNSSGEFNTPFGRYVKPYFPEKEMLYFARKAQKATFACRDFRNTMAKAKPGDAVYCDPPYVPLSGTANFTEYSSGGFGLKEQQKLAEMAGKLAEEGIPVLLSNHDTAFVRQIYRGAQITSFKVRRFISCQGDNRNKAGEILALFRG
ncbi:MAG: Dam family site-specific DNA-(adenine-N6)-methyltransferase [Dethiobacteria bacterium]